MLDRDAIDIVRTVEETARRLRAVDETAAALKPAPDSWSIKEILGHLIDSAVNNHQRVVRAQQGPLAFPGYDQNHWVRVQGYQERAWSELTELWVMCNRHFAEVIRRVPDQALDTACQIGTDRVVTLAWLIEDYSRHMRHHLEEIEQRLP